jgi:hypothetical protein
MPKFTPQPLHSITLEAPYRGETLHMVLNVSQAWRTSKTIFATFGDGGPGERMNAIAPILAALGQSWDLEDPDNPGQMMPITEEVIEQFGADTIMGLSVDMGNKLAETFGAMAEADKKSGRRNLRGTHGPKHRSGRRNRKTGAAPGLVHPDQGGGPAALPPVGSGEGGESE